MQTEVQFVQNMRLCLHCAEKILSPLQKLKAIRNLKPAPTIVPPPAEYNVFHISDVFILYHEVF